MNWEHEEDLREHEASLSACRNGHPRCSYVPGGGCHEDFLAEDAARIERETAPDPERLAVDLRASDDDLMEIISGSREYLAEAEAQFGAEAAMFGDGPPGSALRITAGKRYLGEIVAEAKARGLIAPEPPSAPKPGSKTSVPF